MPSASAPRALPLAGHTVLDVTRMLPGAVLARLLLDLGARLVKVEAPGGDLLRHVPPFADGTGAAFRALYAGAEMVSLDLRAPEGVAALRDLAAGADVLVESFRPGTMERWGLGYASLAALNPRLVYCCLPSFGSRGDAADRVGHDLNFLALSGLLAALPGEGVPQVQIADVAGALLASSAVLAALLARSRDGRGMRVEQPLACAPLPFLAWIRADEAAGGGEARAALVGGGVPAYRLYRCADGRALALGALEPKFWTAFVEMIGLPGLAADGLDAAEAGEAAGRAVAARLAERPAGDWLALPGARDLPLSPVRTAEEAARAEPFPAPWLPAFPPAAPAHPAPPVPTDGEGAPRHAAEPPGTP